MTNAERETIVRWDQETHQAELYTAHPAQAARWRRLGLEVAPVRTTAGEETGWEASCPSSWVKIRRPRVLSDEERARRVVLGREHGIHRRVGAPNLQK